MTQVSKRLDERFTWEVKDRLLQTLREFTAAVELRLAAGDAKDAGVDEVIAQVQDLALTRINEILLPGAERIQALTSLGFLVAQSATRISMGTGPRTFIVTAGDQRDLFTPSAFVTVESSADVTTYGIAQVLFYDKTDGTLALDVKAAFGSADFRTAWTISASAGVTQATRFNMDAAKASADAARADRLLADADAAATGADRLATHADKLAADASAANASASADRASQYDPNSLLPLDGSRAMTGRLRSQSIDLGASGDLKTYIDKGVRTDVAQNFASNLRRQARANIGTIGAKYAYAPQAFTESDFGVTFFCDDGTPATLPLPVLGPSESLRIFCSASSPRTFTSVGHAIYGEGSASDSFTIYPYETAEFYSFNGVGDYLVMARGAPARSALNADRAQTFTDAQIQQLLANGDLAIPHGQCRLDFVSATQIKLSGLNGNKIFINGRYRKIPLSGITAPNTGLSASTLYYVFAYWDVGAATIKLAIGIGAPVVDPVYGHKVAGGQGSDAQNRLFSLVGKVFMNSNGQFQYDTNARWVSSYFNRRLTTLGGATFQNGGTNSAAWIGGAVFYCLTWGDAPMRAFARCQAYGAAAGAQAQTRIMLDGVTQLNLAGVHTFYSSGAYGSLPNDWCGFVSEGMHYFQGQILANGGGANFNQEITLESWI